MAKPATRDIDVTRGDTETIVVTCTSDDAGTPINITGRTYRAQIRSSATSDIIKATFTCTVTNGAAGQVTCVLPVSESTLLAPGLYEWDLEENASGTVTTLLYGKVTVTADVTR